MREALTADDIELICTCDGVAWWQRSKKAKTHMSRIFKTAEPRTLDLLVYVDDNDVFWAQQMTVTLDEILLSKPYKVEVVERRDTDSKSRITPTFDSGYEMKRKYW